MQANRLVGKWPTSLVVPYCSFKPANNSRSSDKCPVNFRFWLAKAWPGRTLWPKGNIKDSILISHLSGRETCGLKISRIHWCGRVIWTERASLESFVGRKNQKMCPNVSIDHSLRNLISSYCFELFVQTRLGSCPVKTDPGLTNDLPTNRNYLQAWCTCTVHG